MGLCALLANLPAAAQASLNQLYPDKFDLNVFEPAPAGDRFFGVADASSMTDCKVRLGLVGDYTLFRPPLERTDESTGGSVNIVSHELNLHAGVAFPITDFLHANADIPFVASQTGDAAETPKGGVFGDPRVGLRANLVDPDIEAVAFGPAVDVWVPVGSKDNLAGDESARVDARLGVSGRAGVFIYSANGGYLFRKKIDTGSLEYGPGFTFQAAVGLSLFDDALQIGPEIWGAHQRNPDYDDSKVTPISALFGAKVRAGDFVGGIAGGPGLSAAPGVAPRLVVSLALAPDTHVEEAPVAPVSVSGPRDGDHDGVPDARDACPDVAGVESSDASRNGCPSEAAPEKLAAAPADSDGDGIPDSDDACPDKLGDHTDDPKTNGCPKPRIADADGDGVRDEIDACPDQKGVATSDPKTNGCPPKIADADGDGVLDKDDACPHDAGAASSDPKMNGCPKSVNVAESSGANANAHAAITYAGFQMFDDGTSRVYVQLTEPVAVEETLKGATAEYRLVGATIPARNNENPLLAEHFAAEVRSARLLPEGKRKGRGKKKRGGSARLVVEMREAAHPEHRMIQNADGTATLVVDFPKPMKPVPPEPDSTPPK